MVSAGKSSSMRSAANAARSAPLLVSKVIGVVPSITLWARRAWAAASVACPHRSISTRGENQRSPNVPGASVGVTNAVSAMPNSVARDCMVETGRGSSRRQTPAGFPENGRSVKASTQVRETDILPSC